MKKNDALKKHHFWILFGLVPLFVLIAVLMVSSAVGGDIEKKEAEIKKANQDIASKTNPKPNALIEKMETMISKVDGKQEDLWKGGWTPQKSLYVFPKGSPLLKQVEKLGLRFGDKIPNDRDQYEEFKKPEVYRAEYANARLAQGIGAPGMADQIAPTQFAGGWEKILRHVNSWSEVQLTSEQIWVLLEDIWVQRSMLDAVRSVNAQMGEFKRVPFKRDAEVIDDPADKAHQDPLRRKFKSRTWEIELEVVKTDNKFRLKGRLINTTDRLQLMGLGNTMILKVWLEPGKGVLPFEFKIGGEFLPGQGAMRTVKDKDGERQVPANVLDIVPTEEHVIPPGMNVSEIVEVEQVFDTRTVPIRLIQAMELGKPDSRNAATPLQMPKFPVWEKEAQATPPASGEPGGSGPGPGSAAGPGPGGTRPMGLSSGPGGGVPGGPGAGGSSDSAGTRSGGGTVASVVDGNKKRYLDVTAQVRRMPVGIVVVVDQSYLQDVLLAFANSPLRFQITQVTWTRYRGSLGTGGSGSGGSASDPSGGVVFNNQGQFGSGFGQGLDPDSRGPRGPRGPMGPRPGGSGIGPPMGPASSPPMGPASNPPGGPVSNPPGGPGSNPFGTGSTGTVSTVSESQLTSGLIELSVYGIVSLYTSPEPPAAEAASTKDKEPKDKEPKDKEPKAPMTSAPKTSKSRRRRVR